LGFDAGWCEARLRERGVSLGRYIEHRSCTGSTNDDALAQTKAGGAHGLVIVADEQTRGRGRHGNSWTSAAGAGLTFSCVVSRGLNLQQLALLPLLVGLSVREVIQRYVSSPVLIKWPNDIWVAGLKLSGILVESYIRAGRIQAAVVGVGLNVFQSNFDSELSGLATSLTHLGVVDVTRERLLVEILTAIELRLGRLMEQGFAEQCRELNQFDVLKGRQVRVDQVCGLARGISESGALLVEEAGQLCHVIAGTVEMLE